MSVLLYLHQTFTDYMSNQYTHTNILTRQMSQQVMEFILILIYFFRILHTIDEYSCLKCCISTKILRIACLIITFRPKYVDMPDVTKSYGRFSGLTGFFGNYSVCYVALHQAFICFVDSL